MISIELLGDQMGDAMEEFVEDQDDDRAVAYIIKDEGRFSVGVKGSEGGCGLAVAHLLASCACRLADPEGWMRAVETVAYAKLRRMMALGEGAE